jgi:hypothetical protein
LPSQRELTPKISEAKKNNNEKTFQVVMPAARELMPKVWPEKLVQQTVWERFAQSKVTVFSFFFALLLFSPLSIGVQEQKKRKYVRVMEGEGTRRA